jgi:hypothetical protein
MDKEGIMSRTVIYGLGGYDPSKPNDNIVEIIDIPDEEPVNEESIDPSSRGILSRLVGK